MAGRKDKNTVDYFPHFVESGKTIFILESEFDNGYKIWFKTLEMLGKSENHHIDLRDDTDLLFLISKLKTTEQELNSIYDLLSKLGAIDSFMWSKKIIFSENFIKNIEDAYKRRNNKCMNKCDLCMFLFDSCDDNINKCGLKSTKKSKGNKSKQYIYSEFYDSEIKKSKNDANYIKVVKILFGENDIDKPLSGILKMESQLSFDQFTKLLSNAAKNDKSLTKMIHNFENGNYYKGKKSVYLSINNWMNK